jgi:hypothetical protein
MHTVDKEGKRTGEQSLWFFCPGCQEPIRITVNGPGTWKWNGDLEKPTISPSILTDGNKPEKRCHSFIKDGNIQFLNDCFHELKGQTVPLPELPEWLAKE